MISFGGEDGFKVKKMDSANHLTQSQKKYGVFSAATSV
jgi:hypothetical protein